MPIQKCNMPWCPNFVDFSRQKNAVPFLTWTSCSLSSRLWERDICPSCSYTHKYKKIALILPVLEFTSMRGLSVWWGRMPLNSVQASALRHSQTYLPRRWEVNPRWSFQKGFLNNVRKQPWFTTSTNAVSNQTLFPGTESVSKIHSPDHNEFAKVPFVTESLAAVSVTCIMLLSTS